MSRTVLVLDDEQPVLAALAELLRGAGFDVYTAASSAEALHLAQGLPELDLLITDIELPDLDGVAFSSVARNLFPCLEVVYMSGKSEGHHTRNQVLLPDARILRKPFKFAELIRLVRSSPASVR